MASAVLKAVLIAAVCAALLGFADGFTRDAIEANWREARTRLASEIIEVTPAIDPDLAVSGECETQLLLRLTTAGYAGDIDWLAAYRPADARLSLRAARHRETPGIGDFIDGNWLSERDDQTQAEWASTDAVSGATLTLRAVVSAAARADQEGKATCG